VEGEEPVFGGIGLSRLLVVFVGSMGAAVGVVASIALFGGSWDLGWGDVGEISEAGGALLSGLALVGVAVSLRMQRRQNQITAYEALRSVRGSLLQFAIENPRFLRLWGAGGEGAEDAAYVSMIFSYLKMAFALRFLSERELVGFCRVFSEPAVAGFWAKARDDYLNDASATESRGFARIVDREYQRITRATP
jgi:hypothetical protein